MQRSGNRDAQPVPPTGAGELGVGPLVIVGGCGHVGLPLGLAFARKGLQVHLLDTSAERVKQVNAGHMPFHEDEAEQQLAETLRSGQLQATTDPAVLAEAAALIVTIGTPVDEYLDPSVREFDAALQRCSIWFGPGSCWCCAAPSFPA